MHELSRQDNDRCYELEQDLFTIGDARVGIEESNLQNPKAQELRTQGLALLENASALLDRMYEAELEYAKNNTTNKETD